MWVGEWCGVSGVCDVWCVFVVIVCGLYWYLDLYVCLVLFVICC